MVIGDVLELEKGIEGASNFDESLITDESQPVKKTIDYQFIEATVNSTNTDYVRANETCSCQQLADAISSKFLSFVTIISLIIVVCWYVVFTQEDAQFTCLK